MTIIKPNQQTQRINWLLFALIGAIVVVASQGVFIYTQIVDAQHNLHAQTDALAQQKIAQTDLQNQLYQLTDSKHLVSIAGEIGLIAVAQPQFLSLEKTVAANQ